jgi:hypothetical protein
VGFLFACTVPAPVAFSARNPLLVKSTPVFNTPGRGCTLVHLLTETFFLFFPNWLLFCLYLADSHGMVLAVFFVFSSVLKVLSYGKIANDQ